MLYVDRANLEVVIAQGANRFGHWRICRTDASIFWQPIFASPHPHTSIYVPALYPDGSGSRFALFCRWARQQPAERAVTLIGLVYGHPSPLNPHGDPLAVPCVVAGWLTANERAAWEASLAARVYTYCESCLQELNATGGRQRYRWRYPDAPSLAS